VDVINGSIDFGGAQAPANTSTFTTADQINGGAGNDVLNLTLANAGGAVSLPAASVTGVETVNVRNVSGQVLNVDASQFAGATAINADRAVNTVSVTNLATGASAGMTGNGTVANGALNLAYAKATDAVTINVSGGTTNVGNAAKIAVTTGSATAATINSTGAANAVDTVVLSSTNTVTGLTINAATNLTTGTISGFAAGAVETISGAATSVNVGSLDANIKTVNAAGLTAGGVTATLNTGAATGFTFTGGAGNDTITVTGAFTNTVAAGAIDGGAGNNTLIENTTALTSATAAAFKNFQVLQDGVAGTQDASVVSGITTLQTNNATAGFSNMTAGQAANVQVLAAETSATFALKDASGTADVLGLTLQNALPANVATVVNAEGLTVDGFETLKVAANSGIATAMTAAVQTAGAYDGIGFTSATSLTSIVATGAFDLDINLANALKVTSVDVSGLTGGGSTIELAANTGALVVTGSAATDIITLATAGTGGTQTINSGAGNDTIIGTQGQITAATINGGAGTDTLSFSDASLTVNDNAFKNVTGVEKIAYTGAAVTHVVGGYANALATANGGVLDITAASLNDNAASSFDATGLSGSNSLKLSATLAHGTGTSAFTVTGSSGADNITISSGATYAGAITVTDTAGTASKVIDLSGVTGAGAVSVSSGAGADTIKGVGGAVVETITAGAGADTVTLGVGHTGIQTLAYATGDSTASAMDLVSNFKLGTDIINFSSETATTLVTAATYSASQTGITGLTATVTAGLVTFGGTAATGLTAANAIAAVTSLESTAADGAAAAFSLGGNTYVVEHHGTTTNVVELVGVSSVATATAGGAAHTLALA
jgi:S-layer protein